MTWLVGYKSVWTPIRQNLHGKYIGRQADPEMAMEAARDLVALTDRMKVHHEDETNRQVHLGFRQEERTAQGKWSDGDKSGTSQTTSLHQVPEYGIQTEIRRTFESPNDQMFWLAQKLSTLADMHYFRVFKSEKITEGVVKWLPKLCVFEENFMTEVQAALERIFSDQRIYRAPAIPKMLDMPSPLPKPEKKPKRKPKGFH